MRVTVALTLALAALLAAAAGAAAAPPDDLSADPLDRGALLALPSVYRVEMTMRVKALRTADGRRVPLPPEGRELEERGTAFAVAPGGWLVTAAHVAAPDDTTVARLAYQAKLAVAGRAHGDAEAAEWVREEGARPVGRPHHQPAGDPGRRRRRRSVVADLHAQPADPQPPRRPGADADQGRAALPR